jgi:hypothetical protein
MLVGMFSDSSPHEKEQKREKKAKREEGMSTGHEGGGGLISRPETSDV